MGLGSVEDTERFALIEFEILSQHTRFSVGLDYFRKPLLQDVGKGPLSPPILCLAAKEAQVLIERIEVESKLQIRSANGWFEVRIIVKIFRENAIIHALMMYPNCYYQAPFPEGFLINVIAETGRPQCSEFCREAAWIPFPPRKRHLP